MKTSELQTLLKDVETISFEAGKILKRYFKKLDALSINYKAAEGAVSQADIETEKYIQKKLNQLKISAHFLGEENSFKENITRREMAQTAKKIEYLWVVDPLDGTHNFINGFDYFSISIALLRRGQPVLGHIFRPMTGEVFFAIKDKGSFKKIIGSPKKRALKKICQKNQLKEAMFVTGFATEKGQTRHAEFSMFQKVLQNSRGVRRLGSAALDLCYVSQGIFDGFWERELAPWDVSAAMLICQEAGVKVTNYKGLPSTPFDTTILAARSPLHKKIINLIKH